MFKKWNRSYMNCTQCQRSRLFTYLSPRSLGLYVHHRFKGPPLKILGQFLLNFMCSFKAGMGWWGVGGGGILFEWSKSHDQDGCHIQSIYGINLKRSRSFSPVLLGWFPWNLACSMRWLKTTKFIQMMTLGWPWPILWQIWPLELWMGKR